MLFGGAAENTRASYPIEYIPNAKIPCVGPQPKNVILLACDAFGVLPPVSKLSLPQTMYHFISGYTALVHILSLFLVSHLIMCTLLIIIPVVYNVRWLVQRTASRNLRRHSQLALGQPSLCFTLLSMQLCWPRKCRNMVPQGGL